MRMTDYREAYRQIENINNNYNYWQLVCKFKSVKTRRHGDRINGPSLMQVNR